MQTTAVTVTPVAILLLEGEVWAYGRRDGLTAVLVEVDHDRVARYAEAHRLRTGTGCHDDVDLTPLRPKRRPTGRTGAPAVPRTLGPGILVRHRRTTLPDRR